MKQVEFETNVNYKISDTVYKVSSVFSTSESIEEKLKSIIVQNARNSAFCTFE